MLADDERHPGAAIEGGLGEGDAHLAGRAVADEPDRIDRLGGAAGSDHDVATLEVGVVGSADDRRTVGRVGRADGPAGDGRDDGVDDRGGLGEAAHG